MKTKRRAAKNAERPKVRIWALLNGTTVPIEDFFVSERRLQQLGKYEPLIGDMFGASLVPVKGSQASTPQRFHD